MTTLKVPDVVGVPEIIPFAAISNPFGVENPGAATHFHWYGATPPEAVSWYPLPSYESPVFPEGGAADVIAKEGGGVAGGVLGVVLVVELPPPHASSRHRYESKERTSSFLFMIVLRVI